MRKHISYEEVLEALINYLEEQKHHSKGSIVSITAKKVRCFRRFRLPKPQFAGKIFDYYLGLLQLHGIARCEQRARYKVWFIRKDDIDEAIVILRKHLMR